MNRKEVSEIKEESEPVVIQPETQKADKNHIRLVWITLIVGLVFNYLFYRKPLGISYPIFVLVFYGIFLRLLQKRISYKWDFGWFLTLPIVLLAFTYFFFSNRLLMGLNFIMIPLLMVAQTILLTNENKYHWFDFRFLCDILHGFFVRFFSRLPKFFTTFSEWVNPKGRLQKSSVFIKVLVGLLISLPLLALVLLLLTSADVVFSHYMDQLVEWVRSLNLGDVLWQLLLIVAVGMFLFSYLDTFIRSRKKMQGQESKLQANIHADSVILVTVLSLLIIVYVGFILIQFRYLFGGSIDKVLPVKYTYAEYARRGFFELIAVTLINFTILLIGIVFQPNASNWGKLLVRILQSLLVLCTGVMLVSAFMRMSLYESQFGYTYLRILTQTFMIFLFVLFVVALIKIWHNGVGLFQTYVVISLVAYLIINYMNIDVFITKKNLERFDTTGLLDAKYLTTLSYDSLPIVLHYFLMRDLPRGFHSLQVHQKVLVSEYFNENKYKPDNYYSAYYSDDGEVWLEKRTSFTPLKGIIFKIKPENWQSYNLSKYRASLAIKDKLNITEERYRKLLDER